MQVRVPLSSFEHHVSKKSVQKGFSKKACMVFASMSSGTMPVCRVKNLSQQESSCYVQSSCNLPPNHRVHDLVGGQTRGLVLELSKYAEICIMKPIFEYPGSLKVRTSELQAVQDTYRSKTCKYFNSWL